MPLTDRPSTPEMKLMVRKNLAERQGKEFNEVIERQVLGLPPVTNPVFLAENPNRAKETRTIDLAGQRELEALAKAAEKTDLTLQLQERDQRIAELERQMGELTGARGPRVAPMQAQPAATGAPAPLPDEEPTEHWTMKQIIQWGGERGVMIPGAGKSMSKREALNHIKAQLTLAAPPTDFEELDDADPEEEELEDAV